MIQVIDNLFFGVGFLKLQDTALITEQLTQKHYDYFSAQRKARKDLHKNLKEVPRVLTEQELSLLFSSTRHHEYKFGDINYGNLEPYKKFIDIALSFPLHFCALIIDKTDPLFNSRIWRQNNGFIQQSRNAQAKTEFVDHLLGKLNILYGGKYPLAKHTTINSPIYLNVWPLRLT